jgi:hypothetical protein
LAAVRLTVAAQPADVGACELCLVGPVQLTEAVLIQHVGGSLVTLAACERCGRAVRRIAAVVGQDADWVVADIAARQRTTVPAPSGRRRLAPPELIREYANHIVDARGVHYVARAYGRPRAGGTWLGWLAFVATGEGTVRRTGVETTQPDRGALEYWAGGLEPIYLEGAFARAR